MITQKVQAFAQSATRWWQSWLDIWRFIQMKSHLLATCVTTNQIKPVIWRHTWIICILNKLPFKTNIKLVWTSLKYNCFRAILAKLGNQESVQFATRWCRGLTYTWGFITMKNHLLATYVTTDRINPQTWTHTFKEGIIDSHDRKSCMMPAKITKQFWRKGRVFVMKLS